MANALIMGAAPEKPTRMPGEKEMIGMDIEQIAGSPFGRTPDGQSLLGILRRFDARDCIAYGDTAPARGLFYGTGITVNKDYYGNMCQTILELVHEATHALWRGKHPISKRHPESIEDATENEFECQQNELRIYQWLKDVKGLCASDAVMELRLQRQADGTLRSTIKANETEERQRKASAGGG